MAEKTVTSKDELRRNLVPDYPSKFQSRGKYGECNIKPTSTCVETEPFPNTVDVFESIEELIEMSNTLYRTLESKLTPVLYLKETEVCPIPLDDKKCNSKPELFDTISNKLRTVKYNLLLAYDLSNRIGL